MIVTHSYPLSGTAECDTLCQASSGQYTFSWIAVRGFFVISGYLIFQSLIRSHDLFDFYWKRILRLYPALIVVLVLTVMLGPFVYEHDTTYWVNKAVRTYIPNNLRLYRLQYEIPGIFEHNPHPSAINGSLWTIPFEFTMYIATSLLFFIRNSGKLVIFVLAAMYLVIACLDVAYFSEIQRWKYIVLDWYLIELGVYFAAGSLLAGIRIDSLPVRYLTAIAVGATVLFVFATGKPYFSVFSVTLLPIIVIGVGLMPVYGVSSIGKHLGDLSYGIYIYGFPVQQTLVYCLELNHIDLMISSLAISGFLAYLSWHYIEAPALKLKNLRPVSVVVQKLKWVPRS